MTRREALGPLTALIEEARHWFPELYEGLQQDLEDLSSRVNARGLGVLLLDLPETGKAYDKGLSSGFFLHEWSPELKRAGKPAIFERLIQASFGAGRLFEDLDAGLVFFTRCVLYLYKKVEIRCPTSAIMRTTWEFETVDSELRNPTLNWDSPMEMFQDVKGPLSFWDPALGRTGSYARCTKAIMQILDRVCQLYTPKYELIAWDLVPKHGPGAVADIKRGTDKYAGLQGWPGKLAEVFSEPYFTDYRGDLACPEGDYLRYLNSAGESPQVGLTLTEETPWEIPARLCAVPKTYKGPRLITVEPTACQYIQQGILRWLRKTFPATCSTSIDFKRQDLSGDMALAASKGSDLATVDLSAASDRLSLWTVERAFRSPSLLRALSSCRSSYVEVPAHMRIQREKRVLKLRKYAGMGNATTFPVQSFIYWCCCVTAVLYDRGLEPTRKNVGQVAKEVRVFGDDLIMPATTVPTLALILDYLQLKVNVSKTHYQGRFRESCGTDAYDGERVTPFYLRHWELKEKKSSSVQCWIDQRNNAYSMGLWSLASWFDEKVPARMRKLIVRSPVEGGFLRNHTFLSCTYAQGRRRFNEELQRWERRVLTVESNVERVVRGNDLDLLQYFLESPGRCITKPGQDPTLWEPGYQVKEQSKLRTGWVQDPQE